MRLCRPLSVSSELRHVQSVPHAYFASYQELEGGIRSLSIKDQTAKNYFYRPGLVDAANDLDFYIHRTDEDHLREYIRRRIEAANERLCVSLNG